MAMPLDIQLKTEEQAFIPPTPTSPHKSQRKQRKTRRKNKKKRKKLNLLNLQELGIDTSDLHKSLTPMEFMEKVEELEK